MSHAEIAGAATAVACKWMVADKQRVAAPGLSGTTLALVDAVALRVPHASGALQGLRDGLLTLEHLTSVPVPSNAGSKVILAMSTEAHSAARRCRDALIAIDVAAPRDVRDDVFDQDLDDVEKVVSDGLFNINIRVNAAL